jgi:hypothetical protein
MLDRAGSLDLSNPSNAWINATAARLDAGDDLGPRRVYLDKDCVVFCLVSPEDYTWATQWRWSWKWDKHKRKRYAYRTTWVDGRRVSLYMHKLILDRAMKLQPTEKHTIGDHQDGESLHNVRENLEWATPSANCMNRRRRS